VLITASEEPATKIWYNYALLCGGVYERIQKGDFHLFRFVLAGCRIRGNGLRRSASGRPFVSSQ